APHGISLPRLIARTARSRRNRSDVAGSTHPTNVPPRRKADCLSFRAFPRLIEELRGGEALPVRHSYRLAFTAAGPSAHSLGRRLVERGAGPATLRIAPVTSEISGGFTTHSLNPAVRIRRRSSGPPRAVRATTGIERDRRRSSTLTHSRNRNPSSPGMEMSHS